jgi:hypothetical protein
MMIKNLTKKDEVQDVLASLEYKAYYFCNTSIEMGLLDRSYFMLFNCYIEGPYNYKIFLLIQEYITIVILCSLCHYGKQLSYINLANKSMKMGLFIVLKDKYLRLYCLWDYFKWRILFGQTPYVQTSSLYRFMCIHTATKSYVFHTIIWHNPTSTTLFAK